MSDAGSTRFPEPPRLPASLQAGNTKDNSRSSLLITAIRDENGQIIRNTGDKTIRIEGEIQKSADNGKIRIKTESGMVDIDIAQEGNVKTPPLRPGMKIEVDIPPERQRNQNTGEIQVQIRVRDTAQRPPPPPSDETIAKPPRADIPYPPRPDIYMPPTKTPESLSPQDIARNLIGVTVRMDPIPSDQMKALQNQLLNTPPPVILPAQLTAQIQALAQSLPLQISAEQMAMALQTPIPQFASVSTIDTPRPDMRVMQIYQIDSEIFAVSTLARKPTLDPTSPQPASIQSSNINAISSTFTQPFDIKSNFLFLSPGTLKTSAASLFPIPLNSADGAPPLQTLQATQTEKPPFFQAPVTAIFQGIQLPEVFLSSPTTPDENALPFYQTKADSFSKFSAILQQSEIGQLSLTIQGTTINNLPIVTLSDLSAADDNFYKQSFILQAPLGGFPAGSIIELSPISALSTQSAQGVLQATITHTLPTLPAMPLMPQSWPVLDDIVQTLQASAVMTGSANPVGAMLPSPQSPAQMGAMALFVIAALKSGDLSQILSERSQNILKASGKSGLASSLSQEGQAMVRNEPPSQDWRALTLPMLWENEVNKVILHYKNDGGGDENGGGEKGKQTRFIFDLTLSRMGKVQLDGLFRDKRMDMVLRTQEPFSRPMQLHIQNGYNNAMELTGLHGDISFQNDPQSWVNIKSEESGKFKTNI